MKQGHLVYAARCCDVCQIYPSNTQKKRTNTSGIPSTIQLALRCGRAQRNQTPEHELNHALHVNTNTNVHRNNKRLHWTRKRKYVTKVRNAHTALHVPSDKYILRWQTQFSPGQIQVNKCHGGPTPFTYTSKRAMPTESGYRVNRTCYEYFTLQEALQQENIEYSSYPNSTTCTRHTTHTTFSRRKTDNIP